VCPWNKFARAAAHPDFKVRHRLDAPRLTELIGWTRAEFEARFEGSAIRRIGHEAFIRNVAVALGNGPAEPEAMLALQLRCRDESELIAEHARWALAQLEAKAAAAQADQT
jgi:epoxyqueuosine reductase